MKTRQLTPYEIEVLRKLAKVNKWITAYQLWRLKKLGEPRTEEIYALDHIIRAGYCHVAQVAGRVVYSISDRGKAFLKQLDAEKP